MMPMFRLGRAAVLRLPEGAMASRRRSIGAAWPVRPAGGKDEAMAVFGRCMQVASPES
jgi:hypothetical protein